MKKNYFLIIVSITSELFAQRDAEQIVIFNNFEFIPSELVIEPGESVAFVNIEGIHNSNGVNNLRLFNLQHKSFKNLGLKVLN